MYTQPEWRVDSRTPHHQANETCLFSISASSSFSSLLLAVQKKRKKEKNWALHPQRRQTLTWQTDTTPCPALAASGHPLRNGGPKYIYIYILSAGIKIYVGNPAQEKQWAAIERQVYKALTISWLCNIYLGLYRLYSVGQQQHAIQPYILYIHAV